MKNTAVYSVIAPLDFSDKVKRAKRILGKNTNGAALVYLMEQFEKNYADEIEEYERRFSTAVKEMFIEKEVKPQGNPLF